MAEHTVKSFDGEIQQAARADCGNGRSGGSRRLQTRSDALVNRMMRNWRRRSLRPTHRIDALEAEVDRLAVRIDCAAGSYGRRLCAT
jgi:ribosomal protein L39E